MTSEEILNHQFEYYTEESYSKESVDSYVKEVSEAYENLFKENKEVVRRLTIFAKKLEEYKKNESYMTETLLTAQKTASQTISGAESVVAKMIEAAKTEGKKIINEAKESANSVYADRDKILADAKAEADELVRRAANAYEEAKAEAEEDVRFVVEDAKVDFQNAIDDIKLNAGSKEKTRSYVDSAVREAEKMKTDARNLRNESFELKKLAVLYREKAVKKAEEQAQIVIDNAKASAAAILLKAQSDVDKINDEIAEKTRAVNDLFDASLERYAYVKETADKVAEGFKKELLNISDHLDSLRPKIDMPEISRVDVYEPKLADDDEALYEAVANKDLDGILKRFGIDPDNLSESKTAAKKDLLKYDLKGKKQESGELKENNAEDPVSGERAAEALKEESKEDGDSAEEFDLNFDDAEAIPEAGEEVDRLTDEKEEKEEEPEGDFSKDGFLSDGDWNKIPENNGEADEPAEENGRTRYIKEEKTSFDGFQNFSDEQSDALDEDFEIDFSMFDTDREKEEENKREKQKQNNSKKKKKKKK